MALLMTSEAQQITGAEGMSLRLSIIYWLPVRGEVPEEKIITVGNKTREDAVAG